MPDHQKGKAPNPLSVTHAATVIMKACLVDIPLGIPRALRKKPNPTSKVRAAEEANTCQSSLSFSKSTMAGIIIAHPSVASSTPTTSNIGLKSNKLI